MARELANASKHMRLKSHDPDIRAEVEWHEGKIAVGEVKVGDLVMNMYVFDKEVKTDVQMIFIEAAGYWEQLLKDESLLDKDAALPPKVIPVNQ